MASTIIFSMKEKKDFNHVWAMNKAGKWTSWNLKTANQVQFMPLQSHIQD